MNHWLTILYLPKPKKSQKAKAPGLSSRGPARSPAGMCTVTADDWEACEVEWCSQRSPAPFLLNCVLLEQDPLEENKTYLKKTTTSSYSYYLGKISYPKKETWLFLLPNFKATMNPLFLSLWWTWLQVHDGKFVIRTQSKTHTKKKASWKGAMYRAST